MKTKMTKAQKKAMLEEQAAERRRQEEEREAAEAANRRTEFKKLLVELKKKDDDQQAVRDVVLKNIVEQFKESTAMKEGLRRSQQEHEEWIVYMRTDGSPDPKQPPELTCALYRWQMEEAEDNMFLLAQKRDKQIFPLMKVLNEIIKYRENFSTKKLEIFFEVRSELLEEGTRTLESGTRRWATLPGPRAPPIPERHMHKVKQHCVALWINPPGPPKMKKPNEAPSDPEEIKFTELGLDVTLPGRHNWRGVVVRALWVIDDILSPNNPLFQDPEPPHNTRGDDLYEFTKRQLEEVVFLRDEQAKLRADFYAEIKTKIDQLNRAIEQDKFGTLKNERTEVVALKNAEPDRVPFPREILDKNEEDEATEYFESLRAEKVEGEINLRKCRLCGGILNMQLLSQPPRPKTMRGDIEIRMLEAEERLSEIEFRAEFVPPPAPTAGAVRAPEEIEAEIKRQEAAMEKLVLIHIQLPETVLWLEPPQVCCWDAEKLTWTTENIHDVKYNEDKFTITFRICVFRPIGFATMKYSNLPYQGWELKPNADNSGVVVTIMGAIIVTELEVLGKGILVKSIQNGATKALLDMVNKIFSLRELTKRFQEGGVDFFPAADAPVLVEGSCPKLPVMEEHLYHCMGHCCTAFNFTWSRWNVSAGRRAIVQQFREFIDAETESLEILHVTPLQASQVVATEVSAEYSTEPIEGLEFYPDLYSMISARSSEEAKAILVQIPWELVENVKDLLWAVKPCSFS